MSITTDTAVSELGARFSRGEREAFAELYKRFAPRVLAFLSSRCQREIHLDDVAQEAWLLVWKARESFDGKNFQAWLFQIVRNHLTSVYRKKRAKSLPEEFDVAEEIEEDRSDELNALRDCLEAVGGDFVEALKARIAGASTAEIAAKFGIQQGTVFTRIDRAKKQIGDCVRSKLE